MIEHRTYVEGVSISIFLADRPKGNIVFASGLPQYIDKYHPVVEHMIKAGYNLIVPRYYGTFDSEGVLTITGATKTVEIATRLAKNGTFYDLYTKGDSDLGVDATYLVGFSFGALPALLQSEQVLKTILVCPFVSLEFHDGNKKYNGESIKETLDFLRRAFKKTYNFETLELLEDMRKTKLPDRRAPFVVVEAEDDKSIPADEIAFLQEKYACDTIKKSGGHDCLFDIKSLLK